MILFINACVRPDSRTRRLADRLLSRMSGEVREVKLWETEFPTADAAFIKRRDELIKSGEFENVLFRLAREFARADEIVIAAPLWDLSFPASLKQYFEQINVVGLTFRYTESGAAEGLCRAKRLYYVSTAGGDFYPEEYGYGYVKALAETFYGIRETRLIKAVGLDIYGADVESILRDCIKEIDEI